MIRRSTQKTYQARFRVSKDSEDAFTLTMGDAVSELFDQWESGTELGEVFNYPFSYRISRRVGTRAISMVRFDYAAEVFAQLGATYISNPDLLQQQAPASV